MTTPEANYDATVDSVRGLIPHRRITDASKPSTEEVEGFLAAIAQEVALVVEELEARGYSATSVTRARTFAKGLVALGAAAMTEDAAHPERTGRAGSSYGEVLWERYTGRLTSFVDLLNFDEDEGEGGAGFGSAGHTFPETNLFDRSARF